MRILVAGGFGFVGGRVAQHLLQAGHQVVLGSRNASGPPNWLPQAEVVRTDWNDAQILTQNCNEVDVVIQAAGMNAQDCLADPVAALEINGLATARLVAAASRAGVRRFIYLSTAHVYASPLIGTISEDTCPHNLHPYALSHLAGENAVLSASQRGEIEGIVLRLSNAFGAPVHKGANCWMLLANDLCRQAVQVRKMILQSSGLQRRDFIAMKEVCGIVESFSSHDFYSVLHGVFNLGSGKSQSVRQMAKLIQQRCQVTLGFEPELTVHEIGVDEKPQKLKYLVSRLKEMHLTVESDQNTEIDNLLKFCHASFSQN